MASALALYTAVFSMLLVIMSGALYLQANYADMSRDLLDSQHEIMKGYAHSNIVIINVTEDGSDTVILAYNNGTVSLQTNKTDLYVNGIFIQREEISKDVINESENSIWGINEYLNLTYGQNLVSGDKVSLVIETGKKDEWII